MHGGQRPANPNGLWVAPPAATGDRTPPRQAGRRRGCLFRFCRPWRLQPQSFPWRFRRTPRRRRRSRAAMRLRLARGLNVSNRPPRPTASRLAPPASPSRRRRTRSTVFPVSIQVRGLSGSDPARTRSRPAGSSPSASWRRTRAARATFSSAFYLRTKGRTGRAKAQTRTASGKRRLHPYGSTPSWGAPASPPAAAAHTECFDRTIVRVLARPDRSLWMSVAVSRSGPRAAAPTGFRPKRRRAQSRRREPGCGIRRDARRRRPVAPAADRRSVAWRSGNLALRAAAGSSAPATRNSADIASSGWSSRAVNPQKTLAVTGDADQAVEAAASVRAVDPQTKSLGKAECGVPWPGVARRHGRVLPKPARWSSPSRPGNARARAATHGPGAMSGSASGHAGKPGLVATARTIPPYPTALPKGPRGWYRANRLACTRGRSSWSFRSGAC